MFQKSNGSAARFTCLKFESSDSQRLVHSTVVNLTFPLSLLEFEAMRGRLGDHRQWRRVVGALLARLQLAHPAARASVLATAALTASAALPPRHLGEPFAPQRRVPTGGPAQVRRAVRRELQPPVLLELHLGAVRDLGAIVAGKLPLGHAAQLQRRVAVAAGVPARPLLALVAPDPPPPDDEGAADEHDEQDGDGAEGDGDEEAGAELRVAVARAARLIDRTIGRGGIRASLEQRSQLGIVPRGRIAA